MSDAPTRLGHPGWRQTRHDALTRELRLRDFDAALALVNRLAVAAEDHLRRPDMCITEFNHVQITVANLHHAGLTPAESACWRRSTRPSTPTRPRKRSSRRACRPLTTAYRPRRGHDDPDAVAARDA